MTFGQQSQSLRANVNSTNNSSSSSSNNNNNNNKSSGKHTNMNAATATTTAGSILSYVTGGGKVANNNNNTSSNNNNNSNSNNAGTEQSRIEAENSWALAGRQFSSSKEMYTRSLYRLCLKFTTSEDEDEGKQEPSTAFWTVYGVPCSIGNAGPNDPHPDSICRRMDDSMSGPAAGILSRLTDQHGMAAVQYALRSGATTGWHIRGERGDAAVRVGKAKVFSSKQTDSAGREAQILSLDADRWVLCKGASFAAGNSVFSVEEHNESKAKLVIHCSKGPMRGKVIDIHASRCPYVFGRAHEADLCVMDRELSRRHGAVLYLPRKGNPARASGTSTSNAPKGNFVLVDLESTVGICELCSLYYCRKFLFRSRIFRRLAYRRMDHICEWSALTAIWVRVRCPLEMNLL